MKKIAKAMYGKSMMKSGGSSKLKKYAPGGVNDLEDRLKRRKRRAETRAEIAQIEGEGTVADKRNNRAERAAMVLGTRRAKVPKSTTYTEGSISTSNTDNRNSGNTYNTTSSNANAGASSNSESNSSSRGNTTISTPRTPRKGGSRKGPTPPQPQPPTPQEPQRRMGGPTKMKKMKMGGTAKPKMMKGGASKMKKYDDGGQKGSVAFNTVDKKTAMKALGIDKEKKGKNDPSNFAPIPTTKTTIETTKKYGGTAKPKMMKGGAKPKAMYGTAMKPGMMKKGGAKKK